ncbi:MAG: DUF362 domain-containing protein [Phycisphaerae bacterium]
MAKGSALALGAAVGAGASARRVAGQQGVAQDASPRVVRVRSDQVLRDGVIDRRVLSQMLAKALTTVTGQQDSATAWHSLLRSDDVVGLKFNRSAAGELGTTPDMAGALLASLLEAGFSREQLVPIEVPPSFHPDTGTTAPVRTWSAQEVSFGSGQDRLAGWLDQITALINVPFLKTHNIAGITCCLKNLSHAVVKHPARFHDNHCSPFIADIVALPQVREKLRLHLVNGLRTVFQGGPDAQPGSIAQAGMLLAGTDPVAVDALGLENINQQRKATGLPVIQRHKEGLLGYLDRAATLGLGTADLHRTTIVQVRL